MAMARFFGNGGVVTRLPEQIALHKDLIGKSYGGYQEITDFAGIPERAHGPWSHARY